MQRWEGVKAFVSRPLGRVLLVALVTLALAASFLYLGPFLAIAVFLFFGLALPIYLGWKRPRQLAVAGLAALLVAAPIAAVLETQMLRVPSPLASSSSQLPDGNGGSVLANATVSPFLGAPGTNFTFTVSLNPTYLPAALGVPRFLDLFVSTCPDATSNTSPSCSPGYPYWMLNHSFAPNQSLPRSVAFSQRLSGANLWWWQMGLALYNTTVHAYSWVFLYVTNGYRAVQGPVTGDFLSTLGLVIPSIYLAMLFYPGLVFFLGLLLYAFYKSRERRRKALQGPTPDEAAPAGPGAPASSPPPKSPELSCPQCHAVVYANESNCWKCGAPLPGEATAPLRSEAPPPAA